jgi:hypothetical protein
MKDCEVSDTPPPKGEPVQDVRAMSASEYSAALAAVLKQDARATRAASEAAELRRIEQRIGTKGQ